VVESNVSLLKWISKWHVIVVEYLVYYLLNQKEMYGNEILGTLKPVISQDINKATLYAILKRASEDNIISVTQKVETNTTRGTPRKYYKLTAEGKVVLKSMKIQLDSFNHLSLIKIGENNEL
jgi:DNA-binding PadR family transcriptional regulator